MYSVILVEDDSIQRKNLKTMILSICKSIKIHEADNESTALEIINTNNIDLFIIDIELIESSGLDLALKIRTMDRYQFSYIVFLTTHVEYIIQALKQVHCYDYITKPYKKDDVQAILNKLILHGNNFGSNMNDSLNQYKDMNEESDKEILITLKSGIYLGIKTEDIIFIEVKGRECEVNTIKGIYVASNMSLKKMMNLINCDYIVQSHRAFLINKNYILKIEKLDVKLSAIYFKNYPKTALLGYKFKDIIISEFRKGKMEIC